MRFAKYLLALTLAFLVCVGYSKAQTVVWEGGGSSAAFLEVGQAAAAYEIAHGTGACVYTYKTSTADWSAKDNRPSVYSLAADVQEGKIWVVYGPGSGTCAAPVAPYNIYSGMSVDSVLGTRCFFEVDTTDNNPGCVQTATPTAAEALPATPPQLIATTPTACATYVAANYCDIATTGLAASLPAAVSGALNGKHWNYAATDVRPEDGRYASYRLLQPCGQAIYRSAFDQGLRLTYGLGYQTANAGIGTTITESTISGTTGQQSTLLDFNISGNDPINTTHATYASYVVTPLGAQPIVVTVSPSGAGTVWQNVTDVTGLTLTLFYQGVIGRTTDFVGATVQQPVTTLVREPLSGTYNTFEYSVPNSSQFHGSQDDNNCNGNVVNSNPMDLGSANGQQTGTAGQGWKGNGFSYRERAITGGDMIAAVQAAGASDARLGYWFWSAANAKAFTSTNGKYLTVNGVDPLLTDYNTSNAVAPGVLPTGANLSTVSFAGLQAGDYPIWSPIRLVTSSASVTPSATGLANILSGLATINPTQHDYVPIANLNVWHSHYYLPAIGINNPSANGNLGVNIPNNGGAGTTLCPTVGSVGELGGDAGGSNMYTQVNYDFCKDFGQIYGIINKNN